VNGKEYYDNGKLKYEGEYENGGIKGKKIKMEENNLNKKE